MREGRPNSTTIVNFIWPVVIVTLFVVSFWPVLVELLSRWDSDDNSYCYAIIPIFLYLCWDIRGKFHFSEFSWNALGLVPIILAVFFIVVGKVGSFQSLAFVGIWVVLVGLLFTHYSMRIGHLLFPILMLAFIVPLPPVVNTMITFKLKMIASTLSANMLRAVGIAVFQQGNIIDMGAKQLQVVDACSGLRYFMTMIVISMLVGYLFTKGWWRRTILVLLVFPLSSLVNGLRIFITGVLIINGYEKLAEDFYHEFTGIVIFLLAGAFLVLTAFLLSKIGRQEAAPLSDPGGKPFRPALPPTLTLIACAILIAGGMSMRFASTALVIPDRINFDNFPMEIDGWHGKRNYLSKEVLTVLGSDDYLNAYFVKEGIPNEIYLLIPYYKIQTSANSVHAPTTCLLGGGWELQTSIDHIVRVAADQQIHIKTMVLGKENSKLLSSYFYYQRGRIMTDQLSHKWYLIHDSFAKRRTDGALVRVEMTMGANQNLEDAITQQDGFIKQMFPLLPKYVPN